MSKNNLNYSVYVHTNKINGKKYVGQSSNIIERWKNGGKNYFSSTKFHRAIQKYGWENFTHEILYENLNKEAANKIERDLIKKYDSINNGYNIQEGGYERVINAVERGNCDVIQAINNCCCNTQKAIIEQGYQNQLANERQTYQITNSVDSVGRAIERGFCDSAYATQTQTCALQNTIRDTGTANTNQIIAKLDAMQNQALLDKIDALREKNSQQAVVINNAQQTAAFGQMIGQATSPIVAAVNALQSDVNGIKCKLPETVTLPYSCATAVPTQAVFNGYALGTYAGWNGCGCNNSLWG